MKNFILLIVFVLTASVHSIGYGADFKYIGNSPSSFFGQPFEVLAVQPTGKEFQDKFDKKLYYTYRIVIQRPSRDDGSGIAEIGGLRMRLYYWAAENIIDPLIALTEYDVFQDIHPADNKKVIVHVLSGLRPGKNKVRIVIFPYPMISKYRSLRDILHYKPLVYAEFLKDTLENIAGSSSPIAFFAKMLYDQIRDVAVDSLLVTLASEFGRTIQFEVPAVMPNIRFATIEDAAQRLKNCSLTPNPDYTNTILTNIKERDKRVARVYRYKFGDKVKAKTSIAYKFYEYTDKVVVQEDTKPISQEEYLHRISADAYLDSLSSEECPAKNPVKRLNMTIPPNHNGNYVSCRYYKNGQLAFQLPYINNKREGWGIGYFSNGKLNGKTQYKDGLPDGPFVVFLIKNGKHYKASEGRLKRGAQVKGSVKRYPAP